MTDNTELKRLAELLHGAEWQLVDGDGFDADNRFVTSQRRIDDNKVAFAEINYGHPEAGMGEPFQSEQVAAGEFIAAANPAVVLALIAENEELGRYLCTCRDCGGEGALHTGDWHSYGHMEPPEPVMEKCGECDGTGLLGEIQDLYQVITERDQLRAEVAGLKTGYEAYERVNAELKAESEALRKALADILDLYDTDEGCRNLPQYIVGRAALGQGEQS